MLWGSRLALMRKRAAAEVARMIGKVASLALDGEHRFSKRPVARVELIEGVGIAGDAHAGRTVRHRSRVAVDPGQPNLRQVHLIHAELLDELREKGFQIASGALGENVLTRGLDLLGLPRGTLLRIGQAAVVEVTGLRNPCSQIEGFRPGLLAELVGRDPQGGLIRRAGIMGIVVAGGSVEVGDRIEAELPPLPHRALDRV